MRGGGEDQKNTGAACIQSAKSVEAHSRLTKMATYQPPPNIFGGKNGLRDFSPRWGKSLFFPQAIFFLKPFVSGKRGMPGERESYIQVKRCLRSMKKPVVGVMSTCKA